MYVSIRDLELKALPFDQEIEPGALNFEGARQIGPLKASGIVTFHEITEEIYVAADLQVNLEMTCDRCLRDFQFAVDKRIDLTYSPETDEDLPGEQEITEKDTEVDFHDGKGLELNDVFQEQVFLEIPLKVLCQEDCKGLCAVCGINRNEASCSCVVKPMDNRWSGLLKQ